MILKSSLSVLAACVALGVYGIARSAPPTVDVGVYSVPSGAVVLQDGVSLGLTPLTLHYTVVAAFVAGGCMRTPPITIRWVSGAERTGGMTLCADKSYQQHIIVSRPADAPGAAADAQQAATQARLLADVAAANAQVQATAEAQNEAALEQAGAEAGHAVGCALAGGCRPIVPYVPALPAAAYPPVIPNETPAFRAPAAPYAPPPPAYVPPVTCYAYYNMTTCH